MNRNTEEHFSNIPKLHLKRSSFDMSCSRKTTFDAGTIVPLYVDADILPGDTVTMDMASVVRMSTPIYPIMDDAFMDTYAFFVPHRLVWEHWKEFWGENNDPWTQQTEYEIPQIYPPANGWDEGSIADYMGIPTKVGPNVAHTNSINALPFRAYAKIFNDWFRDENLKSNANISIDETTRQGKRADDANADYVTDAQLGGIPCKAAKIHDLFTGCLPAPQKGPAITIPMGTTANIMTGSRHNTNGMPLKFDQWRNTDGTSGNVDYKMVSDGGPISAGTTWKAYDVGYYRANDGYPATMQFTDLMTDALTANKDSGLALKNKGDQSVLSEEGYEARYMIPNNLYADLTEATNVTINQLRTAFAIQKYYENAGRTGTRYIEYLRGVFGVESSDARLQRAEYLGGYRTPINIDQVLQTSATDAVTPQGNTAAFSCTINSKSMFTKSFEEHGTLMVVGVIRTQHTYQQGLERMWTRKKWVDFYNPFFANLGEQAVEEQNIYWTDDQDANETAFGYQEAWAEYRFKNNQVTGYMRSNATGSLDAWHFADDYDSAPSLSSSWIDETPNNIDRTLAVTSQLSHQFIADFYFKNKYTRIMPIYSIPGLIDHV